MTAPLHLSLFGVPAAVRWVNGVGAAEAAALAEAWSRCLADGRNDDDGLAGQGRPAQEDRPPRSVGDEPDGSEPSRVRAVLAVGRAAPFPVEAETPGEFASDLTSFLTVAAIEERAGELMMLHAAGLADPATGRTAALVARSGMGKTTATRTLATRFGYVSDETVAIERSGRILPYPKPLSVIDAPPPAPKVQRGPDELGLAPAPAEVTLGAVVLLERQPGLGAAAIEPVPHAEALVDLVPQTSALARIERPLAWLCRILDGCGGAVRVRYTEAHQLEDVLPSLLAREPLAPTWRSVHDGGPVPSGAPLAPGHVRRQEPLDAVEIPGAEQDVPEVLVLCGSTLVRLGGIAPAVWAALEGTPGTAGISRAELAGRLERTVGLPDGYGPLLDAALSELASRGLVDLGG
jgi:hypothetical protein